ncbi:hypothetical protein ACFVU2_01540 [Leifsonia sp. NPDC058194]|uniref:hypothetical protein n=1 Tax=Leifsonia sp. NPDC058194 TaxID=3346374 RepID=UPI0036DC6655
MTHVVVSVPAPDAADLEVVIDDLQTRHLSVSPEVDVRSLDGDTAALIVILLTSQAIEVLGHWLTARARARKSTSVTFDGVTITANSVAEVERVAASLRLASTDKKKQKKKKK